MGTRWGLNEFSLIIKVVLVSLQNGPEGRSLLKCGNNYHSLNRDVDRILSLTKVVCKFNMYRLLLVNFFQILSI